MVFFYTNSCASLDKVLEAMEESSLYLDLLQDLSRLGAAMRKIMTKSLCNPNVSFEHIRVVNMQLCCSVLFNVKFVLVNTSLTFSFFFGIVFQVLYKLNLMYLFDI